MPRRKADKSESDRIAATLSTTLRGFRAERAWTQEMAAERVGLSTEAYARLERGHSLPSYPTLARICEQMETTPDVLLGYNEKKAETPGEPPDDRHSELVLRLTSQLDDLDAPLVEGVARLVATIWKHQR